MMLYIPDPIDVSVAIYIIVRIEFVPSCISIASTFQIELHNGFDSTISYI